MTKLVPAQQVYFDHYRTSEFRKKVIKIMIQLSANSEVTRYLNTMLTEMLRYNRAYKRRTVDRVTGRSRASTRKFGLNRINVRLYGKAGFLPGFIKASW